MTIALICNKKVRLAGYFNCIYFAQFEQFISQSKRSWKEIMSLGIFWFSLGWSNYCIDFAYSSQFLPKPALLRLILGQQVLKYRSGWKQNQDLRVMCQQRSPIDRPLRFEQDKGWLTQSSGRNTVYSQEGLSSLGHDSSDGRWLVQLCWSGFESWLKKCSTYTTNLKSNQLPSVLLSATEAC